MRVFAIPNVTWVARVCWISYDQKMFLLEMSLVAIPVWRTNITNSTKSDVI